MVKKIILCLVGMLLLVGCCSTRRGTDRQILEYQKQIDEYESELRARDRAIESAIRGLEVVTTRSEAMGNDFDDVIRELDEYQRAVEQCLRELRNGASEEPDTDQGPLDSDSGIPAAGNYRTVCIVPGTNPQD